MLRTFILIRILRKPRGEPTRGYSSLDAVAACKFGYSSSSIVVVWLELQAQVLKTYLLYCVDREIEKFVRCVERSHRAESVRTFSVATNRRRAGKSLFSATSQKIPRESASRAACYPAGVLL